MKSNWVNRERDRSIYLSFPKSFWGFLLPVFALSIGFSQRQDADSASSLNLFSWCKDSVAGLHLHFYRSLLNLNNLSCSFQPLIPIVLQNQSKILAFVIRHSLDTTAISYGLLTPSYLSGWSLGGKFFFPTDWFILVRFIRDFFVCLAFQSVWILQQINWLLN